MNRYARPLAASVAVTALIGVLAFSPPASADGAPSSTDVVGVGSDVIQYAVDFAADGDTNGNPGYNAAGNVNRLVNFDATADGNGRNAYVSGTSTFLNPTIVLRAGSSPVQRPNGGSAGLTALINDGSGGVSANKISFARSPNLPTGTQQNSAQANLGSQLHVVQIATDTQVIATATTTNAPAGLSAAELINIYNGTYTHWGDIPSYSGPAPTDPIVALLPQTGAGVRTTFLNALKAANGNTAITVAASVINVEQNDPSVITSLPAAQQVDAIVPFPTARLNLYNSSYFRNPATAYNAGSPPAALAANIKLLSGTAPDSTASFSTPLPYYIIFRQSDLTSTTPWQPGSTLNWVRALFSDPGGPAPFFNTNPGKALLASSGATPAYNDLGIVSSGP